MKLYVAGKWQDRVSVSSLMTRLKKLGHEITEDWTVHSEKDRDWAKQYSQDDIIGVQIADMYVGLFLRSYKYKGAIAELGAALALGKPCAIIGHQIDSCIFTNHPLVTQYDSTTDFVLVMRHD